MPMSEALHAVIKEKLGDEKVDLNGEKQGLMALVEDWYDKFEGTSAIKNANADLVEKKKSLSEAVSTKEAEIADLQKKLDSANKAADAAKENQLTDEERKEYLKMKTTGMTSDIEAKLNAVIAERDDLQTKLSDAEGKVSTLSTQITESSEKVAWEAIKNRTVAKLAEHKITGKRAELAFTDMRQQGMIKVVQGDDGTFSEQYRLYREGKELETSHDKAVGEFANVPDNAFYRDGSPSGGTGQNHGGGAQGGERPSAASMLQMSD